MAIDRNRKGIYEDSNSPEYDEPSRGYGYLWRGHQPDYEHYERTRIQYLLWMKALARLGIEEQQGAIVVAGPGFSAFDNRDFDRGILEASLVDHPQIIVSDWSTDVLDDFETGLTRLSSIAAGNADYVRRDYSGGLAGRFQNEVSKRLQEIRLPEDLSEFMQWVADQGVPEVQGFEAPHLEKDVGAYNRRVVKTLESPEALNFERVLKGQIEVRFIVANMLFAGMFALTEAEFREVLLGFEAEIGHEKVMDHLRVWHRLILDLNNHVTERFVINGLDHNPRASIFAVTDTNVHYCGHHGDMFQRLDIHALQRKFGDLHLKFRIDNQWKLDDRHEKPPHDHHMVAITAYRNGGKKPSDPHISTITIPTSELPQTGDVQPELPSRAPQSDRSPKPPDSSRQASDLVARQGPAANGGGNGYAKLHSNRNGSDGKPGGLFDTLPMNASRVIAEPKSTRPSVTFDVNTMPTDGQ